MAIWEYMKISGYKESAELFSQEGKLNQDEIQKQKPVENILEKKWLSIIRLQKKVMELEQQINQLQQELGQGGGGNSILKNLRGGEKLEDLYRLKNTARHTLQSHRSNITSVCFHPNYGLLASASEDGSIKIWDIDQGILEKTMKGHLNFVNSVEFNAEGTFLVSSSSDMTVKIWDLQSFQCTKTFSGHEHSVSQAKFYQNDFVLSASRDGTIKQWELASGYCKHTYKGHDKWVHCLDTYETHNLVASGSSDQNIIVWDTNTKQQIAVLQGHQHVVDVVKFVKFDEQSGKSKPTTTSHVNGDTEKQSDNQSSKPVNFKLWLLSGSRDKLIHLWDVKTQDLLKVFEGHDNWVKQISVHPCFQYFYSCSDDKTIRVWDLSTGKQVMKLVDCHNHFVSTLDLSRKYMLLASGSYDFNIKIWEIQ